MPSLATEYSQTRALPSYSAPEATHRGRARVDIAEPSHSRSASRRSPISQLATACHAVGPRRHLDGGCLAPYLLLTEKQRELELGERHGARKI